MADERFVEPNYRMLFEQAPGMFMVLDPQLRIVAATDAYLHATLTRREEILGKYVFEVFPENPADPADSERNSIASFKRVLRTGETDVMSVQRHDVRRPEKEGGGFAVRYWSPVNSPIFNPDGSVAYIFHRVENVTEYILQQQQGAEQADKLRERTAHMEADLYLRSREVAETSLQLKLANEELARLYEKAKELDTLKSQFFANVSHELRTPLTLILGPVEDLLQHEDLDEDTRRDLLVVQRNARLLQRHVNDLLDIARMDAGRMPMHYTRIDLAWFVRLTASYFDTAAADRHIRYSVNTPDTLPAEVDQDKVERMVVNLLSNAFKFTPDGSAIAITLEAHAGHGIIRVQDNGPGVPEKQREAIFERFRQGEGGVERRYGGTGLGLAIVREFATLHHGTVNVTEAPGGGALFTLELPLSPPAGTPVVEGSTAPREQDTRQVIEALQRPTPAPAPSQPPPISAQAARILVVEDNPEMNAFLAEILGRYYWVTRAFNGQEGLTKALADPPDLILSDVMMPGMSGDQMVVELRRHRELQDVPIVMLTAKADENLRITLLRQGVQDYLFKPFSMDEVLARVGSLLAQQQRTLQRLRESERRFTTLFERAPLAMMLTQLADGRIVDVNGAFTQQFGYAREDTVGKTSRELGFYTNAEERARLAAELQQRGSLRNIEITVYTKSGEPRIISSNLELLDFGGQLYVLAAWLDITERKHAEEERARLLDEVQRRAAELSATLESVVDGIIIYDQDGRLLYMNEAMKGIVDYTPEQQALPLEQRVQTVEAGYPDGNIIPHERIPIIRALRGETVIGEIQRVHARDRVSWLSVSAAPIQLPDGTRIGAVGVFTDITPLHTAQHEHERLLAEVERRAAELTATFEAIADGLIIYDRQGKLLQINAAAQRIFQYSPEEQALPLAQRVELMHMTRPDGTPVPYEDTPPCRAMHGETIRGEVIVHHRLHQTFWLSLSAAPITLPDGTRVGSVVSFTDVTPLHEAQERERRYLYTLAHNLRAPASIIRGNLELLLEQLLARGMVVPQQRLVDALQRALNRMSIMVDDFTIVSRLEEGKLTLHSTPLALPPYLQEFLQRSSTVLETARIHLELPHDLPRVLADVKYLDAILFALLENAQKFSQPETPIRLAARTQDGEVVISVSDQGIGIHPEDQANLFDSFFRVGQTRTAEGTGLGLYIVKRLVDMHHGHIWVESEPGTGSTFSFSLPVA